MPTGRNHLLNVLFAETLQIAYMVAHTMSAWSRLATYFFTLHRLDREMALDFVHGMSTGKRLAHEDFAWPTLLMTLLLAFVFVQTAINDSVASCFANVLPVAGIRGSVAKPWTCMATVKGYVTRDRANDRLDVLIAEFFDFVLTGR